MTSEFLGKLLDTADFPARWTCGRWSSSLGWLHIVSDIAIFAAYAAIPCLLVYFAHRRRDVPFLPVFWLFAAFILSCGLGHLIEAVIFWHPWYRLAGLVKLITAIVSWVTVIALVPVLPKALALPGMAAMNRRLKNEIEERERAEEAARTHAENLKRYNRELLDFSRSVVDREDRVIELKEEINQLLRESGRPPRYLRSASG